MLVADYTSKIQTEKSADKSDRQVETQLVDRARQGDKQAFRDLVEKYQQRAYHVALRVVRYPSDAEDVVQESFVKAYLSLANFKGESSFYSWLYRIVQNMAIDLRRKKSRTGGENEELTENVVLNVGAGFVADNPEEAVINKQLLGVVGKCLADLTPEHRQVITMREIDGLSYDEIAKLLKVNKGTIMSRLFYARQNLQELLERVSASALKPKLKLVDSRTIE